MMWGNLLILKEFLVFMDFIGFYPRRGTSARSGEVFALRSSNFFSLLNIFTKSPNHYQK